MVKHHAGFDLYLVFANKHKQQALNYFPAHVKTMFLPSVPNILSNMFLVPFAARKYGLDAMLFQNFTSLWPKKLFKVAYIHDMLFLDYPQYYTNTERRYFKYMKSTAARANLIITISKSEQKRLIDNFVAQKKNIAIVHHGISENFKPLAHYPKEHAEALMYRYHLPKKYLLFVGRINIRKNLLTLIKAISLIDDQDIKLIIVGESSALNGELRAIIGDYGLRDRIVFTGYVPEADLYLIYANAKVFCFPSYAEGFGLPPLEAMQCGVPVVVSNRTAMPEVCGDAAVYADPEDPQDIAKKINLLLNNGLYYMKKVVDGIDHSKNFNWQRSAAEILTLIAKAYDTCKNYSKA